MQGMDLVAGIVHLRGKESVIVEWMNPLGRNDRNGEFGCGTVVPQGNKQ
jgi:hypothetical protein